MKYFETKESLITESVSDVITLKYKPSTDLVTFLIQNKSKKKALKASMDKEKDSVKKHALHAKLDSILDSENAIKEKFKKTIEANRIKLPSVKAKLTKSDKEKLKGLEEKARKSLEQLKLKLKDS